MKCALASQTLKPMDYGRYNDRGSELNALRKYTKYACTCAKKKTGICI